MALELDDSGVRVEVTAVNNLHLRDHVAEVVITEADVDVFVDFLHEEYPDQFHVEKALRESLDHIARSASDDKARAERIEREVRKMRDRAADQGDQVLAGALHNALDAALVSGSTPNVVNRQKVAFVPVEYINHIFQLAFSGMALEDLGSYDLKAMAFIREAIELVGDQDAG